MERKKILQEVEKYFDIRELVCPHVYIKFGNLAWQFFRTETLHTLLILRTDIFKSEMYINNWHNWKSGPKYDERGLRCNICELVESKTDKNEVYMSAHILACAFDSDVKGLTAEQARQKIIDNQDKLPCPIRIEMGVLWLHFDTYDNGLNQKVFKFTV